MNMEGPPQKHLAEKHLIIYKQNLGFSAIQARLRNTWLKNI
jgi:hypothetical protein